MFVNACQGLIPQVGIQPAIMPLSLALHEVNTFAFYCFADDDGGLSLYGLGLFYCTSDSGKVMSFDDQGFPPEGLEFTVNRFQGGDLFGKAVDHEIVPVDEGREVVKFFSGGGISAAGNGRMMT